MAFTFYLGNDRNNKIILEPDSVIDLVPIGTVVGKVQWDGSPGKKRWRADYWDPDARRMACKMFPINSYGGDSNAARTAAETFRISKQTVSPTCLGPFRADEINQDVMKYFRFVPRCVDYPDQEQPLDPYFLGCWLGDGTTLAASITNTDNEVLQWLRNYSRSMGWNLSERGQQGPNSTKPCLLLRFNETAGGRDSSCTTLMRQMGLLPKTKRQLGNETVLWSEDSPANSCKHIPQIYLRNDRESRLRLLAGLIDTDGFLAAKTGWEISQRSMRLIEDVKLLAESLGFFTYLTVQNKWATNTTAQTSRPYGRLTIYATRFTPEIPVLIPYKRWKLTESRNTFYPTIQDTLPVAGKRVVWSAEMDARLLAAKGNYSRGAGTDWKMMVANEPLFADLSVGKLRGRYRDLILRAQKANLKK